MAISPLFLILIVFVGVFLFIASASYFLGNGNQFGQDLGKTFPSIGSILPIFSSQQPPVSFTTTTTTELNQTKCTLSGGKCMSINTLSPLTCKLEFFDEAFCGRGWKCCIPR